MTNPRPVQFAYLAVLLFVSLAVFVSSRAAWRRVGLGAWSCALFAVIGGTWLVGSVHCMVGVLFDQARMVILNALWGAIEVALLRAVAEDWTRGRLRFRLVLCALFCALSTFLVVMAFPPRVFLAMRAVAYAVFVHLPIMLLAVSIGCFNDQELSPQP